MNIGQTTQPHGAYVLSLTEFIEKVKADYKDAENLKATFEFNLDDGLSLVRSWLKLRDLPRPYGAIKADWDVAPELTEGEFYILWYQSELYTLTPTPACAAFEKLGFKPEFELFTTGNT